MRALPAIAIAALLLIVTGQAHAAPGDLDRSFGEDGTVDIVSAAAVQSGAFDMAIGPSGSTFVLGRDPCESGRCGRELVVTRFRSDGSVSDSYGLDGTATAFPGLPDILGDPHIAVDSLGRAIVVAQQAGDVVVSRLDPNGAPDSAFGGVRRLRTFSRSHATPLSLAVADDDRIVVASSWREPQSTPGSEPPTGLLFDRLLTDGSLDPSFGSSGSLLFWVSSPSSFFDALALGRDGTAIAGGNTCCVLGSPGSAPTEPILLRAASDGASFDPEFGSRIWGGSLRDRLGVPSSYSIAVKALFLRRNGRLDVLVTAETDREGTDRLSHLLRVRPDGRLDRKFGTDGVRRLPMPADAAAVDSEGRIFAVSRSEPVGAPPALYAFRLSASGRLDRTFGGGRVFLQKVARNPTNLPGAQVAAYAGQRPVMFDQGLSECQYGSCRSAHPLLIRLRGGGSRVSCLGQPATIVGTRRGETLNGTGHRDVIAALGGADTVRGMSGDDLICGGTGRDTILDGPGRDRVRR